MKEKKAGKKAGAAKPLGAGGGDDRFTAIATDPRFARFPKAKARVAVDNRFKAVFEDPRFATATKTDKRGRKIQGDGNESMKKYYRLEAEEEKRDKDDSDAEPEPRADASDSDDDGPLVGGLERPKIRGIRGSVSPASSSDDEDFDDVEVDMDEGILARFAAGDEEDVPTAEETSRLAVVDLEWDRIRAVDIYAILQSFLPPSGHIKRVTVYLSDFGKQRLEEEERYGPRAAFQKEGGDDDDDDDDEEEDGDRDAGREKLRKYERDRLRYYYAVCELDSRATGQAIYHACDGMEFERSSTRLDLRFVPDGQSFEGKPVRDAATGVPSDYTPVDYTSKALQHTNAQLSWDQNDPDRKKKLRRKLTADQLKEEDFAAFLGSDSEEDGDQAGDAEKLRALLLGAATGEGAPRAKAPLGRGLGGDSDSDGEGDMVATFDSRLEEKLAAKRLGKEKTVWEAYQDTKKEKRKEKKLAKKKGGAGGDDGDGDGEEEDGAAAGAADNGFDDPFFMDPDDKAMKGKKDKKKLAGKKGAAAGGGGDGEDPEEARRRAELELLLMDDARLRAGAGPAAPRSRLAELEEEEEEARGRGKGKGAGGAKLGKKERKRLAKLAKAEAAAGGGGEGAAGALDVTDPRFAALFERPEFALDPTDPRYKSAGAVGAIMGEAAKRRKEKQGAVEGAAARRKLAAAAAGAEGGCGALGSGELGAIVANLKRKQGQR